ncbi:MAG: hypothetical protein DIU73_009780, partial [Actinomycetes bacterium]
PGAGAPVLHPLDAVPPAKVDVNADYTPSGAIPRPSLDQLRQATAGGPPTGTFSPLGPGTGAQPGQPATGATPLVPPGATTETGSTPTSRRLPRLQPAGGKNHFNTATYLWLGAIMFALGVVVFQVIRLNL